eukprot:TRINITY_DN78456_c0_g1_i1.p1 TRINITY_DN78456_c0_g1~~TRINITY_DN78456_c0_g1_i1.p1  ORF type:complete len:329 (+),score=27.59 TRINITY_DN78456_c0_g1_i1:110-1096(+)
MSAQKSTPATAAPTEKKGPPHFLVLDAANPKAGVFKVNKKHVFGTKGRNKYQVGKPIYICQKYHAGKCPSNSQCKKLHVNPKHIRDKRQATENRGKCCAKCEGETAPYPEELGMRLRVEWSHEGIGAELYLPSNFLAVTEKSKNSTDLAARCITVTPESVCRLHLKSECTFGDKCNHFHVCRSWWHSWFPPTEEDAAPEIAAEQDSPELPPQVSSASSDCAISAEGDSQDGDPACGPVPTERDSDQLNSAVPETQAILQSTPVPVPLVESLSLMPEFTLPEPLDSDAELQKDLCVVRDSTAAGNVLVQGVSCLPMQEWFLTGGRKPLH